MFNGETYETGRGNEDELGVDVGGNCAWRSMLPPDSVGDSLRPRQLSFGSPLDFCGVSTLPRECVGWGMDATLSASLHSIH